MKYLLLLLVACQSQVITSIPEAPIKVKALNKEKVFEVVANNPKCSFYRWKERSVAPKGFIKGMALLYAKHYCTPNETTKHFAHPKVDSIQDVLSVYSKQSTRDLFTLSLSAGMYESSGKYTCGRDRSANFTKEDSAEAGIFQTSFNASYADPYMKTMLDYKDDCLLDVFKEGVPPSSAANAENWGNPSTKGYTYQVLSKKCPAFHAEFSLIAMRKLNRHFGPSRSGKLEFNESCNQMFKEIENTCQ